MRDAGMAVLAFDEAAGEGDPAARDVFMQMEAVENALRAEGWRAARLGVSLDLAGVRKRLAGASPDVVVNLVESLDGADRLQTAFVMALEEWGIPFTGAGSAAMFLANDKLLSKKILDQCGLPFADCCFPAPGKGAAFFPERAARPEERPDRWIVKPVSSHASLGMTDDSVFFAASTGELLERMLSMRNRWGGGFFAERYVDGREFNLSLVETREGVLTLPPAEIVFTDFPAEKPRIVGYAAKWDENSEEYRNTVRSFAAGRNEPDLAGVLGDFAGRTWRAFGLSGYARVDFRVDPAGNPWILEVNANPCLAPDAGFAAAAGRGGWDFRELCRRIADMGRGEGNAWT